MKKQDKIKKILRLQVVNKLKKRRDNKFVQKFQEVEIMNKNSTNKNASNQNMNNQNATNRNATNQNANNKNASNQNANNKNSMNKNKASNSCYDESNNY